MTTQSSGRIVMFAAERVGLAALKALVEAGKEVAGVFTAHDNLQQSISDWVSLEDYARSHNVRLIKVKSCRGSKVTQKVAELKPDLISIVSWSMIIPESILKIPPKGTVGIHYSLLPKRRGGAPLNWAIIEGLTESGITLYYLDDGIDSGDIIDQRAFDIGKDDTVRDILNKIEILAPEMLVDNIDGILAGTASRTKQIEADATKTTRRRPEDGLIDWSKTPNEIYNFIRALAPPYPCAFMEAGEKKLVVPAAKLEGGKLKIEAYLE